jgi:CubicO group peptidase (beta-lactamase class C family)
VAPGYEKVATVFRRHFDDEQEHCAQVCAFVDGTKVVDLWGSRSQVGDYGPDSVHNIFSAGKSVTSLVVAMLVDRNLIHYDQKISHVWPEFGQHGKENITIAMLMKHEAGLQQFDRAIPLSQLTSEQLKDGSISQLIEEQTPSTEPGGARQYHAMTRGWIVNEIVRRVDPTGRTVREFVHDEIASPLGLGRELSTGLQAGNRHKNAHLTYSPLIRTWLQSWLPACLGGGKVQFGSMSIQLMVAAGFPIALFGYFWQELALAMGASSSSSSSSGSAEFTSSRATGHTGYSIGAQLESVASTEWQEAEIPSANMHASARALAAVARVLVQTEDNPLLRPESLALAHANATTKPMFGGALKSSFGNAGWNEFGERRFGFIGWVGLGGAAMQWHPDKKIGFGYAMNQMELAPSCERAKALQRALVECSTQMLAHSAPK